MTWPTPLRIVMWVGAWPFVVAGWLWDRPGNPIVLRGAAVLLGVVVGLPWIVFLAGLVAAAIPVDGGGGLIDTPS